MINIKDMKQLKKSIVRDTPFLKKYWVAFLSVFVFSVLKSTTAFAAICVSIPLLGTICLGGTGAGCAGYGAFGSLGDIICNLLAGTALLPFLFASVSYLFGIFILVMAIIKTKEHVEDPRQTHISEPLKRYVAAGAFLALPMVTSAIKNTLTAGGPAGLFTSSGIVSGTPTGGGLDAMMFFLIADIFSPMLVLISGFGYLAGIILVMIGISRLLKTSQEGPRGPSGIGTIFTFIVAGVLFSIDTLMRAATGSLFGFTTIDAFGIIATTGDILVDNHIQSVISSIVAFMILVGLIAFVRGIFILRDVAEGNGQASLMAALSHIIGGALAVNIGGVVNAVQSTFGLSFVSFV